MHPPGFLESSSQRVKLQMLRVVGEVVAKDAGCRFAEPVHKYQSTSQCFSEFFTP